MCNARLSLTRCKRFKEFGLQVWKPDRTHHCPVLNT